MFIEDQWTREEGGGRSRVLTNGAVFEQAGSTSRTSPVPPCRLRPPRTVGTGRAQLPCDGRLVGYPSAQPLRAHQPRQRAFLHRRKPGEAPVWWFGGGFDLTPFYGFEEDAVHWHRTAADSPFGDEVYPKYKQWCDDYFFIKHRNEARGIGGLFYDDLNTPDFDHCFAFTRAVGRLPRRLSADRRKRKALTGRARAPVPAVSPRPLRRVQPVWDRGTLFGLQTGGRTESILMSMPPLVRWEYNYQPDADSPEAALARDFLPVRDWLQEPK